MITINNLNEIYNIEYNKRIYYYIPDNLLINIKCLNLNEELIEVKDIPTKPFWEDKIISYWNEEIDNLINLEINVFKDYVKKNDFWIYVRKSVYEKLKLVNENFMRNWYNICIKLWYRPKEIQKILFDEIFNYFYKKYKDKNENYIYEKTLEYIADPNLIAPHMTWWAIDLVLIKDWKEVDMWCPINRIWEEAKMCIKKKNKNREFLAINMVNFWFANLASERWHFSYWDNYWAWFYWTYALYWNI